MGCVASKLGEEEEVVTICRERKCQLKLAVERRYALAEAHCKYFHSLCAVAAAINLFVARYFSPSHFLITFPPACPAPPPTENVITNPMFLQQTPSEPKHEAIACDSCASSTTSESSEEEREEKGEGEDKDKRVEQVQQPCGYYYMHMPPAMPSPQKDFRWDFFNPFDVVRTEVIRGYRRNSDDDLRVVREEEGIPELEEEGEREELDHKVVTVEQNENAEHVSGAETMKVVHTITENPGEQRGLTVLDAPEEGRELLDALKDIEDHFVRAFDSGKDVTRMLEANRIPLHSSLEDIKGSPTKLIHAITWHRSTSSRPSSCESLMISCTKNSSTWMDNKNDLFDDYGGMDSGSHSLTLGRVYAWEKKLYEEVKAGDRRRKSYKKKCAQLRNKDVRVDDKLSMDETRAAVKDLHAGILVAIKRAESISNIIQKMRDEELQPQIVELLKGLTPIWKIMLESHEFQNMILSEVKSFTCPTYGKFCNESHRLATLQLETQLQSWRICFREYIAAQRAYVEALHGWLRIVKDMRTLWQQQGEEQQQKRKVDSLAKDLDRRYTGLHKVKSKMLELNVTDQESEVKTEHQDECLMEKKDQLEAFRRKLVLEKEKHHICMQETQRITLYGLQSGFSRVFESLVEFSKASKKNIQ